MSHTRKTDKKELGILSKVSQHLQDFSEKMQSEINSTKDGSFLKSIKFPTKEKDLKLISEKSKGFDDQLITLENKANQLFSNYSSLNTDMQIACLSKLKDTLAPYKEALESLLPKHKAVDMAPLDKIKEELNTHFLNINKLGKAERDLLDTMDTYEKNLRKGIIETNETRSFIIATTLGKFSEGLMTFVSRIHKIEKSINERTPSVSVTSNAIWNKAADKMNSAGDNLTQHKKPASTKS